MKLYAKSIWYTVVLCFNCLFFLLPKPSGKSKPDGCFLSGIWFICCRWIFGQNLLRTPWVVQEGLVLFAFDAHPRRDGIPQSTLGLWACRGGGEIRRVFPCVTVVLYHVINKSRLYLFNTLYIVFWIWFRKWKWLNLLSEEHSAKPSCNAAPLWASAVIASLIPITQHRRRAAALAPLFPEIHHTSSNTFKGFNNSTNSD